MQLLHFLLLAFSFATTTTAKTGGPSIGVNYGQLGNNLPSPSTATLLIKSLKASSVKLYDANPQILTALSQTHLHVSIMLPNELIPSVAASQSISDKWVQSNLLPFLPRANIRYLLVGNEILSPYQGPALWTHLVPAMVRVQRSLRAHNIRTVKVSTTVAMDAIQSISPPSNAAFRPDIANSVVKPLLAFLNKTKSAFHLDAYPYFAWSAEPKRFELDYALFEGRKRNLTVTDPATGLTYTNLLDQMLDSIIFGMKKLGFPDVKLTIAETGWPTAGDGDQIGANVRNAAIYNRNLVKKLSARPPAGTPARVGVAVPAFIFALFNENQKGGPATERNWGLFYPNGTAVYKVDLSGKKLTAV